jgi:hypothetical protein
VQPPAVVHRRVVVTRIVVHKPRRAPVATRQVSRPASAPPARASAPPVRASAPSAPAAAAPAPAAPAPAPITTRSS